MDVSYPCQGQSFVWDASKAAANLHKHQVSFEKACEVFAVSGSHTPAKQCRPAFRWNTQND